MDLKKGDAAPMGLLKLNVLNYRSIVPPGLLRSQIGVVFV